MKAILWSNGMFMVVDVNGEQVPELQGCLTSAGPLIHKRISEFTEFQVGDWENGLVDSTVSKLKCLTGFLLTESEEK